MVPRISGVGGVGGFGGVNGGGSGDDDGGDDDGGGVFVVGVVFVIFQSQGSPRSDYFLREQWHRFLCGGCKWGARGQKQTEDRKIKTYRESYPT